jgi:hypothetical protein
MTVPMELTPKATSEIVDGSMLPLTIHPACIAFQDPCERRGDGVKGVMTDIYHKLEGDQYFTEDTELHGIAGSAHIRSGVRFYLNGIISGNLFVEEDSDVQVRGMVDGDVINEGGQLLIEGTVHGTLIRRAGNTIVAPHASIGRTL